MSDELIRVARRGAALRKGTAQSIKAFKKPRAADAGERIARRLKAEKSELKRRKKAKRAFKKR